MEKEKIHGSYGIQKCKSVHMISYFPDGSIQTKHLCSCAECVVGKFIYCLSNPGTQTFSGDSLDDSDSGSDTEECDTKKLYNEISRIEQELWHECITDIVVLNSFIALFSPPESFELCYLCHAFSVETASEMVINQYNHIIQQGEKYIVCKYLENLKEKRGHIYYKSLAKIVYVLPAQVLCPLVMLDENLSMSAADYQWLSDGT